MNFSDRYQKPDYSPTEFLLNNICSDPAMLFFLNVIYVTIESRPIGFNQVNSVDIFHAYF